MGKASLLILSLPESIRTPSSFFCFPSGFSRGSFLGGECSIQLSYEDMSDFWLKIRLSGTFQSFRIGSRLFNYLCFLDELLHPTFLDTFAFGGKLYNTYFDRFELSSSFSIVQRRQASPFLRRGVLYPFNYGKLFSFIQYIRNKEDID